MCLALLSSNYIPWSFITYRFLSRRNTNDFCLVRKKSPNTLALFALEGINKFYCV